MSILTIFLSLFFGTSVFANETRAPQANETSKTTLKYVWTQCDNCQQPESVYFDKTTNTYFVSNVVGEPNKKDGQGWIQKVDVSGKVLNSKWVTGLNAPKGIRVHGNTLWVSDIDEIVSIDIKTGKVTARIAAPNAKFLNDVAVDAAGTVYVTDTIGSRIYQVKNGKASIFYEGADLDSPNGILVVGSDLIVASWGLTTDWNTKVPGSIFKLSLKDKKKTLISKKPLGNLDGLEIDTHGNYIVSDWVAGKVYSVKATGESSLLVEGMKGAADIAVVDKTLVVPRMGENQITAFDLTMATTR